jgi:hypothetical protein
LGKKQARVLLYGPLFFSGLGPLIVLLSNLLVTLTLPGMFASYAGAPMNWAVRLWFVYLLGIPPGLVAGFIHSSILVSLAHARFSTPRNLGSLIAIGLVTGGVP